MRPLKLQVLCLYGKASGCAKMPMSGLNVLTWEQEAAELDTVVP